MASAHTAEIRKKAWLLNKHIIDQGILRQYFTLKNNVTPLFKYSYIQYF